MLRNRNIYIKKLCFYWDLKKHPNSDINGIPNFLPFRLGYDPNLRLLIQKRNKEILKFLNKTYKAGSDIGNIQSTNPWSEQYGGDFLNFIFSAILDQPKRIKKILEIGCGEGHLLKKLKQKGYKVCGIEPSPSVLKAKNKTKVEIINEFFPTKKLKGRLFDLIFHSCVLEHVIDPVDFLKYQFEQLNSDCILVISTPDYTDSIENGDISMILHEHLNYFDKESLKRCVEKAGFESIHIERAKFGGLLYCLAKKRANVDKTHIKEIPNTDKYNHFLRNYKKNIFKLNAYIRQVLKDKNRRLGFYAPVRALPYVAVLKLDNGYRFFDDNQYWHLKYIGGINIPIENFNDLKSNPVTDLIIMSPTFGEDIKQRVKKVFASKITIRKITDFFSA